MITLGINQKSVGQKSWLFDFETLKFESLNNMIVQRIQHVCSSLKYENNTNVFCVAGYSDPNFVEFGDLRLRQMEIYEVGKKHWRLSNHFLPYLGKKAFIST